MELVRAIVNGNIKGRETELLSRLLEKASEAAPAEQYNNGMVGAYVIVRCRDAGVHAGVLESHNGRECVLSNARRLWYWKPANGAAFLSGVAQYGLDTSSKTGVAVERIHLTENCEIIMCSSQASTNIEGMSSYVP